MGRSSGASGLRRGPWRLLEFPWSRGRDREPSSLRWMAPYRLSKLDCRILRKFRGNTIPGTPAGTLAAKALKFTQSVPLRRVLTRPAYLLRALCP